MLLSKNSVVLKALIQWASIQYMLIKLNYQRVLTWPSRHIPMIYFEKTKRGYELYIILLYDPVDLGQFLANIEFIPKKGKEKL